eukprot:m.76391 g.76391  ORF g.76391 m.76391 type:complete len:118 (+) comp8513_c0_seq4:479-832(+)
MVKEEWSLWMELFMKVTFSMVCAMEKENLFGLMAIRMKEITRTISDKDMGATFGYQGKNMLGSSCKGNDMVLGQLHGLTNQGDFCCSCPSPKAIHTPYTKHLTQNTKHDTGYMLHDA